VTDWDSGQDYIAVGTDVNGSVGGGSGGCPDQVWDVYLTAGQPYGSCCCRTARRYPDVALPQSVGRHLLGRTCLAEFEAGNADGRTYTAPASDWYGVVVFNNSPGSPRNYTLRVKDFPAALASASCQGLAPVPSCTNFTQSVPYWTAVGDHPSGVTTRTSGSTTPRRAGNSARLLAGTQGHRLRDRGLQPQYAGDLLSSRHVWSLAGQLRAGVG